jgi:cell division initiation protein
MEITPRELRDTEIHSEMRGYSRDEVNDLLERAAASIEASNQRVTQLQDRLTSAQSEASRTRETEDILHRTLLLAQRAADEAVAEATAKSRQMVEEAEMSSRRLIAESESEARRKGDAERQRLEHEIVELAGRRDTLLADVEALTRFEAEYRERMVRALESDLSALKTRPTTAPAGKPEASEVELPASLTTPAESAAPSVPEPTADDVEAPVDTDAPNARLLADDIPGAQTSQVDVRTLFEQQSHDSSRDVGREEPGPAIPARETIEPSAPAPAPAARPSGFQPIDLSGPEGVDADILDDDAFFATLRDAVHDDAPLGPREEGDDVTGENVFFDQDADRASFRDVFRRRR